MNLNLTPQLCSFAAQLLHFAVCGVLATRPAKLPRLEPIGVLFPILGRRVIPVLAIVALQRDDFAHRSKLEFVGSEASTTRKDLLPHSSLSAY